MSTLDSRIDDLYRQPPGAFVAARNALARTLAGADAAQVKRLVKPTAIPWAVNQVYWRARPLFDRVRASGEKLRQAQIATLAGRSRVDVAAAHEAHRQAVARAVQEASRLAAGAGVSVSADALARTFEALSLARESPAPPGRLTQPLQPAGFEALAGVTPREKDPPRRRLPTRRPSPRAPPDIRTRSGARPTPARGGGAARAAPEGKRAPAKRGVRPKKRSAPPRPTWRALRPPRPRRKWLGTRSAKGARGSGTVKVEWKSAI